MAFLFCRTVLRHVRTAFLLDQLIRRLAKDFVEKGGIRERIIRAHLEYRSSQRPPNT